MRSFSLSLWVLNSSERALWSWFKELFPFYSNRHNLFNNTPHGVKQIVSLKRSIQIDVLPLLH